MFSWSSLQKPVVGLSAIDGVSDAAMRQITALYGEPDFLVTEFTSADGVVHGVRRLLRDLYYTPKQRPIIAQIFGVSPDKFYRCAVICCFLGFDGIDINMGCPADSIAKKGGGATLINNPPLAKEIINAVKKGVEDFTNGIELNALGLPEEFVETLKTRIQHHQDADPNRSWERTTKPVSVKTRIGYEKAVTTEWVSHLLEAQPALITLHGRTLEQHYGGMANWEEIAKGAQLAHQTDTLLFGNGDLDSPESIVSHIKDYGVDGAWIARAAMGNPWIFAQYNDYVATGSCQEPTTQERFTVAIEHATFFEKLNSTVFSQDPYLFLNMRKHLGWYVKSFPNASEVRAKLFQTNTAAEVQMLLESVV